MPPTDSKEGQVEDRRWEIQVCDECDEILGPDEVHRHRPGIRGIGVDVEVMPVEDHCNALEAEREKTASTRAAFDRVIHSHVALRGVTEKERDDAQAEVERLRSVLDGATAWEDTDAMDAAREIGWDPLKRFLEKREGGDASARGHGSGYGTRVTRGAVDDSGAPEISEQSAALPLQGDREARCGCPKAATNEHLSDCEHTDLLSGKLRAELASAGAARVICAEVSGLSPENPEDVADVRRALVALTATQPSVPRETAEADETPQWLETDPDEVRAGAKMGRRETAGDGALDHFWPPVDVHAARRQPETPGLQEGGGNSGWVDAAETRGAVVYACEVCNALFVDNGEDDDSVGAPECGPCGADMTRIGFAAELFRSTQQPSLIEQAAQEIERCIDSRQDPAAHNAYAHALGIVRGLA